MNQALELLDVLESSHLALSESFSERKRDLLPSLSTLLESLSGSAPGDVARTLAEFLLSEGVLFGELSDIAAVVAEYFHVMSDEAEGLGDDEMQFLNNYLK